MAKDEPCFDCMERHDEATAEARHDSFMCHCACHGCDCCMLCRGQEAGGCSSYPEYNCPGHCEARGEPGHFKKLPDGSDEDFPTRA